MDLKQSAREDAMSFLSPRNRTAGEVRKRLKEKGHSSEDIDEAMDFLVECHMLNDDGYCDDFIQREMEKGRGPRRIFRQLEEKGISGELAQMKLEEWFDRQTERKYALTVARKLWSRNGLEEEEQDGLSQEERQEYKKARDKALAKVARKLEYQGFSNGVIFDVLSRL